MSEERLQEIKDSIKFQYTLAKAKGYDNALLFTNEEEELVEEIERLNNIINEFDKWLLGEQMMFYKGSDDERLIRYGETKNKWLEIKGEDKK